MAAGWEGERAKMTMSSNQGPAPGAIHAGTIDTHVHVWDTGLMSYEWLETEVPQLRRPHLPADYREGGAARAIFVQAGADGDAEASWVQGLAPEWPELAGIVAFAPVEDAELSTVLDRRSQLPLFVGVRRVLQDEPPGFIRSDAVLAGLQLLAARGIPFDACVRHRQLVELTETLEHVPELSVVLDHLGKPPVGEGLESAAGSAWLGAVRRLAQLPRVHVKLSGLAPEADPDRRLTEQAQPFLVAALEAFGPTRSMVGSDWPVSAATPHQMSTAEWFDLVSQLVSEPADRSRILSGTAEAFYGLGSNPALESSGV
jgi:L-fuconolactonase